MMTIELWMLAAAALLQFALISLHGTHIALSAGVIWGVGRRNRPREISDLGRRIERTIINNMESLVVFIPLVLIIQISGLSDELTRFSVQAYLAARFTFAILYIGNIPYLRTVMWLTGQGLLLTLGYAIVAQAYSW